MSLEVSVDLQEVITVDFGNMEEYSLVDLRVTRSDETRVTRDDAERIVSTGTGKSKFLELDLEPDTMNVEAYND